VQVTWICHLAKPVSYLFDGVKHLQKGIPLLKGTTRSITEGDTKLLGKLIDSATKKAANKRIIARLTELLAVTDALSIHGEYNCGSIGIILFPFCISTMSIDTITRIYGYLLLEEVASSPKKCHEPE